MKITFGMNAYNTVRSVYYAAGIVFLIILQMKSMDQLERVQRLLFTLQMTNESSFDSNLYCDIPYENCRCSIISIDYCLTDEDLKHVRVVPLILFVLEIYLIRKLTSLSGDYIYVLIYVSWIIVLFTFISILIIIYGKTCYYNYAAITLCFIGYGLFNFVCLEVARNKEHYVPPSNNNIVANTEASETTNHLD